MGSDGMSMNYAAIKAHQYFNGINFDTLESTSPPIPAERYKNFFLELKERSERRSSDCTPFSNLPAQSNAQSSSPNNNAASGNNAQAAAQNRP